MHCAKTLHSGKQNQILGFNFSGETNGRNMILPCIWKEVAKNAKFFWYQEIERFKNYQECFAFTLENFSLVSIQQSTGLIWEYKGSFRHFQKGHFTLVPKIDLILQNRW